LGKSLLPVTLIQNSALALIMSENENTRQDVRELNRLKNGGRGNGT
jgi:hypothetical protein